MYTVLIAEDELLVRVGIKTSATHSGLPFHIVGTVSDGVLAYSLYKEHRPDILITDLRMPGMDGMELIERVRKEDDHCEIIVITCLEDDQILKRIAPQVSSYLLKATMTVIEINEALVQAVARLEKKPRREREKPEQKDDVMNWIVRYIKGYKAIPLPETPGVLVVFSLFLDDKPLQSDYLLEIAEQRFASRAVFIDPYHMVCLLEEKQKNAELLRHVESVRQYLEKVFSIPISAGTTSLRMSQLPEALTPYIEPQNVEFKRPEIQKAISYVRRHPGNPITLNEMAEKVGLSPNYFSHLFTQAMGIGFIAYINRIRIERAMYWLQYTDRSLLDIALSCGFSDETYFSRLFKQKVGKSPQKWRQLSAREYRV